MKRLLIASLILLTLTGCAPPKEPSQLDTAKQILSEIKEELAEDVKPEYFESDEWKAFVDGYWDGYNKGQDQMKEPEYMEGY